MAEIKVKITKDNVIELLSLLLSDLNDKCTLYNVSVQEFCEQFEPFLFCLRNNGSNEEKGEIGDIIRKHIFNIISLYWKPNNQKFVKDVLGIMNGTLTTNHDGKWNKHIYQACTISNTTTGNKVKLLEAFIEYGGYAIIGEKDHPK